LKFKIYFEIRNLGFFPANFVLSTAVLCQDFSRDTMAAKGRFVPGFFLASRAATQSTPERPVGCGEGEKMIRGLAKVGRGEGSTSLSISRLLQRGLLEVGKGKND